MSISRCPTWAGSCTRTRPMPPPGRPAVEDIPCVLTMMADEFGGPVPVGPFAIIGDDSIGRGIVETLSRFAQPRRPHCSNHGPFTIGATAADAVKAAVMVEEVAKTVHVSQAARRPAADSSRTRSTVSTTATRTSTDSDPRTRNSPNTDIAKEQLTCAIHSRARRSGSSPAARVSTARRPSTRSPSSHSSWPARSTRPRTSPSGSSGSRS
jgi:hypothetical protein